MNATGVLTEGWTYVWAAYAIVWGGMLLYGASLVRKVMAPAAPPDPDRPDDLRGEA